MSRLDLVRRVLTAATLVALAVTLGVWLTRSPLTAAAPPVPTKTTPQPRLAPPSVPISPDATPAAIEVPVEVEIAAPAAAAPEPPAAKPAETKPESHPACQPRRRGLFRRR